MNDREKLKPIWRIAGYFALHAGVQLLASVGLVIYSAIQGLGKGMSFEQIDTVAMELLGRYSTLILLMCSAVTIAAVFFISRKKRVGFGSFCGFAPMPASDVPLCVAAGVSANIWFSLLINLLPIPESMLSSYADSFSGLTTSMPVADFIAVVLAAPIVEEIIYRGLILNNMNALIPAAAGVVLQGILFGAGHEGAVWMIYAAVLGCILGYVRMVTGSLWASLLMHAAFNASSYLFDWMAENWLTESGAVTAALIVSAVVFGSCVYAVYKRGRLKRQ